MIFRIFSPKNFAKKLAFFAQNKAKLCKNWIITLVFKKNANFFAENWQKSQKIVIITSTPVFSVKINMYIHNFCRLKNVAQKFGIALCKYKKAKSKRPHHRQKLAQSGHPYRFILSAKL
jgi:hypothetical protein